MRACVREVGELKCSATVAFLQGNYHIVTLYNDNDKERKLDNNASVLCASEDGDEL